MTTDAQAGGGVGEAPGLTAVELAAVEKAMLYAAWCGLGSLPYDHNNEDPGVLARRVIRSIKAAEVARRTELDRIKAASGGKRSGLWTNAEPIDVAATAYWFWTSDEPMPFEDLAPASVAGNQFIGFALGFAAARALSEASDMLQDDGSFSCSTDGVMTFENEELLRAPWPKTTPATDQL